MEIEKKTMVSMLFDIDDFEALGSWVEATVEECQYPNTIPESLRQFVKLYKHWVNGNID